MKMIAQAVLFPVLLTTLVIGDINAMMIDQGKNYFTLNNCQKWVAKLFTLLLKSLFDYKKRIAV
jgi:hypothetical protein